MSITATSNFAWPTQEQFWNSFLSLPQEKRQMLIDRQKIKAGNHEFDLFAKYMVPAMNQELQGKQIEIPDIHRKWWNHINTDDRFVFLCAPVGFAKSSVMRIYACKSLLVDNIRSILYISSTQKLAQSHLSAIKEILKDPIIQELFDYTVTKDNESEIQIQKSSGWEANISCLSKETDLLGTSFKSSRPGLLIFDDLEDEDQAKSKKRTDDLQTKLFKTYISRLPSVDIGKVRMIGTILTKNALHNRIVNNEMTDGGARPFNRWKKYFYTCFNEEGKSIWERMHSTTGLLQAQKDNPSDFACNYLNAPREASDTLIKSDWLNYYNPETFDYSTITECYAHFDLAFSQKESGDFFAGQVWGRATDKKLYLLDIIHDKCTTEAQTNHILNTWQKWHKTAKLSKITYDAINGDVLFKNQVDKEALMRNINLRLVPVKFLKDKIAHVKLHEHWFTNSQRVINLPVGHRYLPTLEQELLGFPNEKHDDLVDALTGTLDQFSATKKAFKGISKSAVVTMKSLN